MHRTTTFLALSSLLLASGVEGQSTDPLFDAPWRAFDVGDFPTFAPSFFDAGDIDGDGDLDVVASREYFGGPGISVLRSNGDGSFAAEEVYELDFSNNCGEVRLADIDMDGDLDAVATITGSSGLGTRVAVWRNNGDGTYAPRERFATGEGPIGLLVEDFTGDGFPDMMTADNGFVAGDNNTVSLLKHNGQAGPQAGFMAPVQFQVGDNCTRLAAADIDGDGDLDVAVGRGAAVSILVNDGAGGFDEQVDLETLPSVQHASFEVYFADMDNDGDADLLTAGADNGSPSHGKLGIRRNNGSGVFDAPEIYTLEDWTFTPHSVAVADLNGDGWPDPFVSTPSGRANDGWNVLLSDGKGGFHPARRYEAAKQTFDLAAVDADDDGDLDVLTVANDSSVVTVHLNDGVGGFSALEKTTIGFLVRDLVEGDIDQDGDLDLVSGGDDDVHFMHNNGAGEFPNAERFDTPFSPNDILLADMNNDGCLDLVIRNYDFGVALNDCEGGFDPVVVTSVGSSQAGEIGAFDLDNDGDLDIVCTDPGPASRVYLFRNNGNGTSFTFMNVIADADGLPFGVGGGDLNHDGNIDLIFNNALGLTVYLGNGDFTVSEPFPTSEFGYPFVLHDLNADGELDLAFKFPEPSFGTTEVGTMMGLGDGSFTFANAYPGPTGREGAFRVVSDVDVADATNDGIPDVIFTNNAPNDIAIFPGVGNGELLPQDRYGAGYSASDSALGDFNQDGLMDVGVVVGLPPSGLTDALVVLYGTAPETSGDPADVTGVEVATGTLIEGGIAELEESDDSHVHTRSGFGRTFVDLHNMEMIVTLSTAVTDPATLDVTYEGRIDEPTGTARLRLWNFDTGEYEQVASFPVGTEDVVQSVEDIGAPSYVGPDGEIRVSLKEIVFVPVFAFTFDAFTDQIEVIVR